MKRSMRSLFFVFVTLYAQLAFTGTLEYVLGEGDVLRVTVYDHPDLTTIARVSADGTVRFPLIGQVDVGELTVEQISNRISNLLADGYIINPQVSVFVEEFRSQKATIMGEVAKPGLYELRGHTTFLELLSKAGGLTKETGDKAIVKRKAEGAAVEEQIITVDLKRLMEGGDTSLDAAILDGDSVYVGKAGVFYVTGEVKKADAYKYEEGTTLIMAVTMAGGFTDKAAKGRVRIIRRVGDAEIVFEKVEMHELIRPDDVIVVPESFF
jgi:polysaccharide export outer membrane protein